MTKAGGAKGILIALTLSGCASEPLSLGSSAPAAAPDGTMAGRWMLTAPNAPACGMQFGDVPEAKQGSIAPEGGCPGNFFMSRRWTLTDGGLTINDQENRPLAQFTRAGGGFEGQSTASTPVTLTR